MIDVHACNMFEDTCSKNIQKNSRGSLQRQLVGLPKTKNFFDVAFCLEMFVIHKCKIKVKHFRRHHMLRSCTLKLFVGARKCACIFCTRNFVREMNLISFETTESLISTSGNFRDQFSRRSK